MLIQAQKSGVKHIAVTSSIAAVLGYGSDKQSVTEEGWSFNGTSCLELILLKIGTQSPEKRPLLALQILFSSIRLAKHLPKRLFGNLPTSTLICTLRLVSFVGIV